MQVVWRSNAFKCMRRYSIRNRVRCKKINSLGKFHAMLRWQVSTTGYISKGLHTGALEHWTDGTLGWLKYQGSRDDVSSGIWKCVTEREHHWIKRACISQRKWGRSMLGDKLRTGGIRKFSTGNDMPWIRWELHNMRSLTKGVYTRTHPYGTCNQYHSACMLYISHAVPCIWETNQLNRNLLSHLGLRPLHSGVGRPRRSEPRNPWCEGYSFRR